MRKFHKKRKIHLYPRATLSDEVVAWFKTRVEKKRKHLWFILSKRTRCWRDDFADKST